MNFLTPNWFIHNSLPLLFMMNYMCCYFLSFTIVSWKENHIEPQKKPLLFKRFIILFQNDPPVHLNTHLKTYVWQRHRKFCTKELMHLITKWCYFPSIIIIICVFQYILWHNQTFLSSNRLCFSLTEFQLFFKDIIMISNKVAMRQLDLGNH